MKKIFKTLSLLLIITTIISCEDYLDVNTDPNNPGLDILTPNDILSGAQSTLGATYSTRMNQLGNLMAVTWSANLSDFADPYGEEFRYDFSSRFYDDIWDNIYTRTNNFRFIENYNDGKNWNNHIAVSKILKAFYLQYIVDLYGNAPYSDIHQGENTLFPKYDDATSIYRALYDELDAATDLIDNPGEDPQPFLGSDVTFSGNMTSWKQFANTIKLRMLVRQTELAGTNASVSTYITSKFNELNGEQFISSNVTMNPGYQNADGKFNPFYATYGFDAAGNRTNGNRATGASKYFADFLNSTSDPRRVKLWRTSGNVVGTEQAGAGGRPSRFGPSFITSGEGANDVAIMLASESYFLQAEAIQRGYLSGDAQTMFNNGISASFDHLGISNQTSSYMSSIASTPNLGWSGDLIEAIITQKYIALANTSGLELWIEHNRTGFPNDLPLPRNNPAPNIPVRLLYPASEFAGNSANVPNQTLSDAFSSKIFWDVN